MDQIVITKGGKVSVIFIGSKWRNLKDLIPSKNVVILTDDNIHKLYGSSFPDFPVLSIVPGEQSKRLNVIEGLAEKLLELGIDRTGYLLAVGGGVVCDIAGFLASIYMRGIRFGYVSSSLLSQVDASTGGKNGVNLADTKNILGCFSQPEIVVCDTSMLLTLPDEEFLSGIAELVKTAIIKDKELFSLIEQNVKKIIDRDTGLLTDLVGRSVEIKSVVVTADEKETGLRRILNFGHTYGHAIEMYTSVRHGFAVASGMELAAEFSVRKGLLHETEKNRIRSLLHNFGLIARHNIPDDLIERFVRHDKKKSGSDIHFVFISGIGDPVVQQIPVMEVVDFYKYFINK